MTRDELTEVCRCPVDVGDVKHEEFLDYIAEAKGQRRIKQAWVTEATAYMSADGRPAMSNADHCRQGKPLMFENPLAPVNTPEELTLRVVIAAASEAATERGREVAIPLRENTDRQQQSPEEPSSS